MQLKLQRTQREGGVISTSVIFCLTARVQFSDEERRNLNRYKLYNQVIYNSEASKRALEKGDAAAARGTTGGYLKSIAHSAMAAMRLNISVKSLEQGQYIECKSMDELLGAEEAIYEACSNLKGYLELAATFDGREVVVDFDSEEPTVTAVAQTAPVARSVAKPAQAPAISAQRPELPPPSETEEIAEFTEVAWEDSEAPADEEDEYARFDEEPAGMMRDIATWVDENPLAIIIGALVFLTIAFFLIT